MRNKEKHTVKEAIVDAFIELLSQKEYLDITVTDIVKKAEVARASFYRNFDSITDVVDHTINELSEKFIDEILPVLASNDERKLRSLLFEHFYCFTRNQNQLTLVRFQNAIVLFSRMNEKMQERERELCELCGDTIRGRYLPCARLGVICSIAARWVDGGMKETPEEIIDFMMSLLVSF